MKRNFFSTLLFSALIIHLAPLSVAGQVIYVDVDAAGPTRDGSSWANAYNYLQDALSGASSGDNIWVAAGLYEPDSSSANPSGSGDRTATFQLITGVALYGGYAGFGEPDPNVQDSDVYESILSGDLNRNDAPSFVNNEENSYHVVTGNYTDSNAILDGFTIIAGNADSLSSTGESFHDMGGGVYNLSGSPTIKNCKIIENYALTMGGGMYNRLGSSPILTNCTFIQNRSDDDGGGMRNYINCNPIITDCSFINNSCYEEGGGIGNRKNSNAVITNCIFIGNAASAGGGMENHVGTATPTGEPVITNCLFVGNIASEGAGIRNNDPSPIVTNCTFSDNIGSGMSNRSGSVPIVSNCIFRSNTGGSFSGLDIPLVTYSNVEGGFAGEGNINTDPFFADAGGGDYHLKSQSGRWDESSQSWVTDGVTSPCIDAGNPNSSIGSEPFPNGSVINMGVYGGTGQASKSLSTSVPPQITSAAITDATVNQAYSYDVDATGIPAATYSLTTFPAGMTIDANTGVIDWIPSSGQLGVNAVTVTASNGEAPDDAQSFNITVAGIAPQITSAAITDATVNQAYSYDVDATGIPAATYSLTTFPAGMTIDANTGVIDWIPSSGQLGVNAVTVTASNGEAPDDAQSFNITVAGIAPQITSAAITDATVNQAYSYDVDATGIPAATYSLTTFPAGMTIDANTGVIDWIPSSGQLGVNAVTVTASNGEAPDDAQSFNITVAGIAPQITSAAITDATVNQAYSYDVDATGIPAATYSLTTFPAGMTIDANTGVIDWIPSSGQLGVNAVTVTASNGEAPDDAQSFNITVAGIAPQITSAAITDATVNQAYSYDVDATGIPAATYSLTTFPAGMTIDANTGVIDWIPSSGQLGVNAVTVTASNGEAPDDTQSFNITVAGIAPQITSAAITDATVNQAYSYDVDATGIPAPTYSLTTFPAGMTIDAGTGVIDWIPSSGQLGVNAVTVTASNGEAPDDAQSFNITVAGIAPQITSAAITDATVNQAYSYDVDATGIPAPTYSLTGSPAGMTIDANTGVIDWIPSSGQLGVNAVTVTASNGEAADDTQSFAIDVAGTTPSITSTEVTTATVNQLYSYDVEASGIPAPTYALTVSPPGMTLDTNTGLIQWTPDANDLGVNPVTVEAANSEGTDTQVFAIDVAGTTPSITSAEVTAATVNQAYSYDVDATGIPAPTYSLTGFPAGMTIDANTGVIDWIPSSGQLGVNAVTVTASNGEAADDTQSFAIDVAGTTPSITSTEVTTATVNQLYSYDVEASGIPAPTYALTVSPPGMTLDTNTGLIQWTPDANDLGVNPVTVEAANSEGTDTQVFAIDVAGTTPSITSAEVTAATVNQAYSYDVDATGIPAPTYSLTGFPAGMTIDANTGVIDWIPSSGQLGVNAVTVTASNGEAADDTQSFAIDVAGTTPSITSAEVTTATVNQLYSYDVEASGIPAPTYALTVSPPGMTLDTNTGLIQWTPDANDLGVNPVTVEAANSEGTDTQVFAIDVAGTTPSITSTEVTTATVNQLYSYDVEASGIPAPTYSLTTFPAGMTIDANTGVIDWIPSSGQLGLNAVTVTASNGEAADDTQSFAIDVAGTTPSITSTEVTTATVNQLYSYDVEASGIPAPTYALTVSPPGMTLDTNTGLIQWTPDANDLGVNPVTVEAANSEGTDTQVFNITVLPSDNFDDNRRSAMWQLFVEDSNNAWVVEDANRLNMRATGDVNDLVSFYIANGWSFDINENFAVEVDFHYSNLSQQDGWAGISIEKGGVYAGLTAGSDSGAAYYYAETDSTFEQISRASDDGTLYVSYDSALDELYLSYTGYGASNAWQTVSGLLQSSGSVSVAIGGGSNNVQLVSGEAYLDNFEVTAGTLLDWPPAADINLDGFIDLADLLILCGNWLTSGPDGDITGNGFVDLEDFSELGLAW